MRIKPTHELNTKAGVYKITSNHNGLFYIGSSVNIRNRYHSHRASLRGNYHRSKYLQHVYNKYGSDNLIFEVLTYCPKEYILRMEQWFLDNMKPLYNNHPTAKSAAGRILSQEHKDGIRKGLMGNTNGTFGKGCKRDTHKTGIPRPQHVKDQISKALLGRTDIDHTSYRSDPTKMRHREVLQFTVEGNLVAAYFNMQIASNETGANRSLINLCCQGKKRTAKGFIWQYKENENQSDSRVKH